MGISEVVVVVCAVVSVLSLALNFIMFAYLNSMRVQTAQMHVGLGSVLGKVLSLEQITAKMANGMTEFIDVTGNLIERMDGVMSQNRPAYRTSDGRYTANTLEELIEKIKEDNADAQYFTEDDITKLRRMFEEDDDDDDDEED